MFKKIVLVILIIVFLVLFVGFVKFNFSDDDIYVQNSKGQWVKAKEVEDKTK